MARKPITFPKDFIWGTAVASHQADGHNEHSDWWAWEKKGKIYDGTVSGAAADMLHRYPEDFALMQELGYNGFRFSTEWARVEPRQGEYSEEGLDHCENVVRELKKRGMKVCLTLYHWVLPKWVADRGGWAVDESVDWFRGYVRRVIPRVFDHVDLWCTLNEPTAPLLAGYVVGEFPPQKRNWLLACKVFRNLLRAHAAAYEEIMAEANRRGVRKPPKIGIAHAITHVAPRDPGSLFDRKLHQAVNYVHNVIFLEAMKTGRAPFPLGTGETIPGLAGSYTYMGVNYYYRMRLQIPPRRFPPTDLTDFLYLPEGTEISGMGYEVFPEGFYHVLKYMSGYGAPLYVTENGCADPDDTQRPGYVLRHLAQMRRAMQDGMDVRGYFQWSWIDNFEWRYGFERKLGVIELDPETMARKPRPSAYMYGEIARTGKITPTLVRKYAPHVAEDLWPAGG